MAPRSPALCYDPDHTTARIAAVLRHHPALAASDLGRLTALSPATVQRALTCLQRQGVARSIAVRTATRGRTRLWLPARRRAAASPTCLPDVSPLLPGALHDAPPAGGVAGEELVVHASTRSRVLHAVTRLAGDLAAAGGVRLAAWSDCPLAWPGATTPALVAQGGIVLACPSAGERGVTYYPALICWDAGDQPLAVWVWRLRALARLTPHAAASVSCPPVLLVCATPDRLLLLRATAQHLAGEGTGVVPVFLTQDASVAASGLAGAPWQNAAGHPHTLLAVLRAGRPLGADPALPWGPSPLTYGAGTALLRALRGLTATDRRALVAVGHMPLATPRAVATVVPGLSLPYARALLARLTAAGALDAALPPGAHPRRAAVRYVLTDQGLALLAAAAGLTAADYRRATGVALYPADRGTLAEASAAYWDDLAHADAVAAVYRAFATSPGPSPTAGYALLDWRREGVAVATLPCYDDLAYDADAPYRALRPDGTLRLRVGGAIVTLLVEVDRATQSRQRLAAKCDLYAAWQAVLARTTAGYRLPPIVVITTGARRMRTLLDVAGEYPLDVRVVSLAAFQADGPFACRWWRA